MSNGNEIAKRRWGAVPGDGESHDLDQAGNAREKLVGRKFSKRQEANGLVVLDPETHHRFSDATRRYKAWAILYLERNNINAEAIIARALKDGMLNEGAALRHHVNSLEGVEPDHGVYLAARLYELCRDVEHFQTSPELFRPGSGLQAVFELGRVSMLSRVYGVDDEATKKRIRNMTTVRKKFTDEDRDAWRELRATKFSKHTDRSAARLILKSLDLPEEAFDSVRKELGRKK